MKTYRIAEVFYSLQGEGRNAGRPAVFVRFAGCNLKCDFCDTDHRCMEELTLSDLRTRVAQVGGPCQVVIFTGGEPMLQLDVGILRAFRHYYTALETNGTLEIPEEIRSRLNWVTVSPKKGHGLKVETANEMRLPIRKGEFIFHAHPGPSLYADHYYLSPISDGKDINKENLAWAIKITKENPLWNLSVQQHKVWGIE